MKIIVASFCAVAAVLVCGGYFAGYGAGRTDGAAEAFAVGQESEASIWRDALSVALGPNGQAIYLGDGPYEVADKVLSQVQRAMTVKGSAVEDYLADFKPASYDYPIPVDEFNRADGHEWQWQSNDRGELMYRRLGKSPFTAELKGLRPAEVVPWRFAGRSFSEACEAHNYSLPHKNFVWYIDDARRLLYAPPESEVKP